MELFDNYLFRASSFHHIAPGERFKLKSEIIAEAQQKESLAKAKYLKKKEEYELITNHETEKARECARILSSYTEAYLAAAAETKTIESGELEYKLTDGAKTHLINVYAAHVHGVRRRVFSKYLEKGNILEEEAITMYCMLKDTFAVKNKERKDNDWNTGEIDFRDEGIICDTKVSWDLITFLNNMLIEKENQRKSQYFWNMQVYMSLWGEDMSKLIYCLIPTPKHLVDKEIGALRYSFVGTDQEYQDECDNIVKMHNVAETMELRQRIIEFDIERDEELIYMIPPIVNSARKFLNNLHYVRNNF